MFLSLKLLLKTLVVIISVCYLLPNSLAAETVVVCHPEQSGEEFSTGELLRIYAMRKRNWSDGTPITVYTLPKSHSTHQEFVTQFLKLQPHQLNRLWHKLVFSGTGVQPEVVVSYDEMLEKVAATPGAIGYVDDAKVNVAKKPVVKVALHE